MRLVDDLSGPPASMVDPQHPANIINNITYNALGVTNDSLGNFINETFGYSTRGALSSYGAGPAYGFNLGFASNYNITSANDSVNGNWTYSYDQFNRLASSMKIGVNMTYAYDRFGNRWQQNGGGGPTPQYVIDTNNHITNGGYSYDALGNLTNDNSGHTFVWDAENRLASVNGTSYVYDAFGRRVKGASNEILYDLEGHPVIWLDATNGNWAYGEIYAGNRHVATYSGGTTNFLHTDWLGNKRVTTSVTGANSETCTGLPFGDGNNCTGTNWSYLNFTDLIHDFESNTEHTLFRQLSTTQGRWLSPDPAGLAVADPTNPQSWNRYAYVMNSPTVLTDPLGLWCRVGRSGEQHCTGSSGGDCWLTLDGISSPCSFATSENSGPAIPAAYISGAGFAVPRLGNDNSISWSFGFPTIWGGQNVSSAALAESLGLPNSSAQTQGQESSERDEFGIDPTKIQRGVFRTTNPRVFLKTPGSDALFLVPCEADTTYYASISIGGGSVKSIFIYDQSSGIHLVNGSKPPTNIHPLGGTREFGSNTFWQPFTTTTGGWLLWSISGNSMAGRYNTPQPYRAYFRQEVQCR